MIINVPAPPPVPPRELDDEPQLTHGGRLLTLTVLRQAGKRTKRHTTTYAVEAGSGLVRLVKADGKVYVVTQYGCDCEDAQFKGRERSCKHWTGCVAVGLLNVASGTSGA